MKAFVWKKINLDYENGAQVAKKDLKGIDPAWKGKVVIWKNVIENNNITMEIVEELFEDKTKVVVPKIQDTGKVDMNKLRTFFPSDKSQNLFIVMSRLPKVEIMLNAFDNLNTTKVTQDNLQSLLKNWPSEEYEELLKEAEANPEDQWEKTEAYFIALGVKKKFDSRIKLWLF